MGICRLRRLESATALRDLQILTERCLSRVSNQAKSERLCKLSTFVVVGIVLSGVVDELVVDTCELLEAVEIESDSCSSSTGSLARHEHVHLGVRSVAHVVSSNAYLPREGEQMMETVTFLVTGFTVTGSYRRGQVTFREPVQPSAPEFSALQESSRHCRCPFPVHVFPRKLPRSIDS